MPSPLHAAHDRGGSLPSPADVLARLGILLAVALAFGLAAEFLAGLTR